MEELSQALDEVFRREKGRVVGALVRMLGSIDAAEEAFQEAVLAALPGWRARGVPASARASGTSSRLASHRLLHGYPSKLRTDLHAVGPLDLVRDSANHVAESHRPARRLVREEDRHHGRSQAKHADPQRDLHRGGRLKPRLIDDGKHRLHVTLDICMGLGDSAHRAFSWLVLQLEQPHYPPRRKPSPSIQVVESAEITRGYR